MPGALLGRETFECARRLPVSSALGPGASVSFHLAYNPSSFSLFPLFAPRVKGKPVEEVLAIKNSDIAKHLNLPPVKLHCSMLAEDAIKAAVADWKKKNDAAAPEAATAAAAAAIKDEAPKEAPKASASA